MSRDPGALLLIDKGFDIRIHAVGHHAYEQPCGDHFTGIRIRDVGRVTGPVDLDLFAGFSGDMHRCMSFLLILLDVIAELGIHEGFFAGHSAFLQVFRPQELFVDSVAEQFLVDVIEVRHLLRRLLRLFGKHHLPKLTVSQGLV